MRRIFKTEKSFRTFFEKSEDDLLCFFIISSDLTGLPVDLFFDDSKSYEMWNHQLWIYFRNSYDKSSRNFLPMNVSEINPIIPIESYKLNITQNDLHAIQYFIKLHYEIIKRFANTEIDCEDVVNSLKYSSTQYRIAEETLHKIDEMSLYPKEKSGLPVDIWLDHGTHSQHALRIKFKASNEQRNQKEFSSITISENPEEKNMPNKPTITKDELNILKEFVKSNVELLYKMSHASTSEEFIELRNKLNKCNNR